MSKKKPTGQYFTISPALQDWVFERTLHKSHPLLEPSFGAGHLLLRFKAYDPNYPMTCYEIDHAIQPLVQFNEHQTAIYADFLAQHPLDLRYKTIVGNPPYIKQRAKSNLYIQFVEKCVDLLEDDGELIFIVPSDFLKLTSAAAVLSKMCVQGRFTDFLFPNDERLFDGASIDVVLFRYQKTLSLSTNATETLVNGQPKIYQIRNGIITFSDNQDKKNICVEEQFNAYVGLVSGRDEIYRTAQHGNIDVLMDKDRLDRFLFPESFPTGNPLVDDYLISNKTSLLERRIKKFTENNWFEWGAPRNLSSIRANWGRPCIYVRNLTRNREVAFLSTVQYFGGGLLCLIPKESMSETDMKNAVDTMNSAAFQNDYIYSGRFKIGHKQICNARI